MECRVYNSTRANDCNYENNQRCEMVDQQLMAVGVRAMNGISWLEM